MAVTRFLHTADWQLGMWRRFLSPDAQARFSAARIDAVRRVGLLAKEQACALVVVAGDAFESNQIDRGTVRGAMEAMAETSLPFYLLPGNHDSLEPGSIYKSDIFRAHCPENVHVLRSSAPVMACPGVELVAAPWLSKRPVRDLMAEACTALGPMAPGVRIVIGHGVADAMTPYATGPNLINIAGIEEAIQTGSIAYVALGDRHSTTSVGSTGAIWYSGTPEPTDFDETNPGNVLIVEIENGRASVTPHHVASWRFLRQSFDVNGQEDVDSVREWLAGLPAKTTTALNLSFVGTVSLQVDASLKALLEEDRDLFAAIQLRDIRNDLAVLPDDTDFAELGLSGFASAGVATLREQAAGVDGEVARDALGLLFRLVGSAP